MEFSFELNYEDRKRIVVLFEKPIKVKPNSLIGDGITRIDNDYLYDPKLDLSGMTTTPYTFTKWIDSRKEYQQIQDYYVYVEYDTNKRQPTKIGFLNYKDVWESAKHEKIARENIVEWLKQDLRAYYFYYFAHDFYQIRNGNSEYKERFNSIFTKVLPLKNESGVFSIINEPSQFLNNNREKWEITKESIIRKNGLYNNYNIVEENYLHISCPEKKIYLYAEDTLQKKFLICLE